jgi:hypothetical protein
MAAERIEKECLKMGLTRAARERRRNERLLRALDSVCEQFELGGVTYTFDPRQADKRPAISQERSR